IQQKGLNLNVELGPELPKELVGDEVRIRQILLNLLNNAKKYTEEGGICISVDMVDRISGPCIRFTVKDTGIGIDECDIEFIFERFYQVSQAGLSRFGGSGLGLAISKHLTESMGGEIGVESVKNKGSNFWFTIPCSIAKEEVRSVTNLVPIRTTKLGKILLVEDLEYNRDLAVELLTKYGHTIDVAENGAEAVSMVQNGAYDLVLMDIRMPVMDGLTATAHIRNLNHKVSNIPIIAMTANTLPDEVKLFGKVGMNDYIAKPYRTEELMTKIGTYLNRSVESEQILQNVVANLPSDDEPALNLFGEKKLNKMTQELIRRIDEFSEVSPSQMNRFELARKAHDVISLSGMLGYHTLSHAYLNLEEACKNDLDVPVAFNAALVASEPLITNAKTTFYHA
ncbi:MAG: ATP-binding protein, partial [Anaerolineales bacterium]